MKRLSFLKNVLVLVIIFLGGALSVNAQQLGDPIEFSVEWGDPTPGGPGIPKTPVLMPTVWQSGHLLDFQGGHNDYVLRIVDATDTVVYYTAVFSTQTQVWLPTYLVGAYRIELLTDDLLYYGYITL